MQDFVYKTLRLVRISHQCHNKEEQMLESNVRIFIILRSGEDLTSFNEPNSANFSGESKVH